MEDINHVKAILRAKLARPTWLRGIGTGSTAQGAPAIKVNVASITAEIRAAVGTELGGYPIILDSVGDIGAQMILDFDPNGHNSPPEYPAKSAKYLGYWAIPRDIAMKYGDTYAKQGIALPWPSDFIDLNWDPAERSKVAAYLAAGPDVEHYRGRSACRICHEHNGSTDKSDGTYTWPQGFSHYIEAHSVKPPQEFIDHVLRA